MQPDEFDVIYQALAASADDLTDSRPEKGDAGSWFEQRLSQVTRAALDNVPGADCVGLTMQASDGTLSSYGQTSGDVAELDRLQVALGEGPCLDAIASGAATMVHVPDFTAETTRWARFCAAAVEQGMRSLLSFAMAPHGSPPGAVNIYSRETRAFDDTAKAIAGGFAMQAAIVVYGAERVSELEEALQSRDIIGQAKGILMHRDGIDAGAAFGKLVRASQETNMKLVDVARWLTGQVTRSAKDEGSSHSPDTPIAR